MDELKTGSFGMVSYLTIIKQLVYCRLYSFSFGMVSYLTIIKLNFVKY